MVGKIQIILLDNILWSSSWQYKPRLAHSSTKHMQIVCECVHCFCPDLFLQIKSTSAVTSYIKTFCILFNLSKQVYIYIYIYNIFFWSRFQVRQLATKASGLPFAVFLLHLIHSNWNSNFSAIRDPRFAPPMYWFDKHFNQCSLVKSIHKCYVSLTFREVVLDLFGPQYHILQWPGHQLSYY